jgi:hypothetical protein
MEGQLSVKKLSVKSLLIVSVIMCSTFILYGSAIDSKSVSAQSESYKLIREWGESGDKDGQFARPHDMDFSPSEDKLYIELTYIFYVIE